MKEYKRYTSEQIAQANNADIANYVQTRFKCEIAGKEIHIRGFGGLYVNPETNEFFCHSANNGGKGLLEFCKKMLDMPFLEAMRTIVGEAAEVNKVVHQTDIDTILDTAAKGNGNILAKHFDEHNFGDQSWSDLSEIVEVDGTFLLHIKDGYTSEENSTVISSQEAEKRISIAAAKENNWFLTDKGKEFYKNLNQTPKAADIKQFIPKAAAEPQEKKEFSMPERSDNGYKNIYAYFINTRSISPDIVREFANKGLIYPTVSKGVSQTTGKEYQKINAVFLHKNEKGEPCGADIQGIDINPDYRFKGCTPRDESDRGFVYDKGSPDKIDTVYLFEAPIDLMSFVELHPEIENAKFVALSGLKPSTAEPYINSDLKVVSCVDNDTAGIKFNNQILFAKMQDSIGTGENIKCHTVQNGEIPINYCSAKVNGKECGFYLSWNDFFTARKLGAEVPENAASWINRSNFSINRECAEAGVKDFNDLLKETKFASKTQDIAKWADNVIDKAKERMNEHQAQQCI